MSKASWKRCMYPAFYTCRRKQSCREKQLNVIISSGIPLPAESAAASGAETWKGRSDCRADFTADWPLQSVKKWRHSWFGLGLLLQDPGSLAKSMGPFCVYVYCPALYKGHKSTAKEKKVGEWDGGRLSQWEATACVGNGTCPNLPSNLGHIWAWCPDLSEQ